MKFRKIEQQLSTAGRQQFRSSCNSTQQNVIWLPWQWSQDQENLTRLVRWNEKSRGFFFFSEATFLSLSVYKCQGVVACSAIRQGKRLTLCPTEIYTSSSQKQEDIVMMQSAALWARLTISHPKSHLRLSTVCALPSFS